MESNTLYANIVFTDDHKSKRTIVERALLCSAPELPKNFNRLYLFPP